VTEQHQPGGSVAPAAGASPALAGGAGETPAPTQRSDGRWVGRWMLLPLLAALAAIMAYPVLFSGRISLQDYRLNALEDVRYIGLEHYLSLPGNTAYVNAMRNTAIFVVIAVGLELMIGTLLAVLVHRQRKFQNLTRALLLTPMFVTPIAVGLMFRFLLNQQLGLIPEVLRGIGVSIDFFGPQLALVSLALIDVWQWTPLMFLLVLAGLESLPREPFEAARVDGASGWFTFRRVTLPMLKPVLIIAVVIRALDALRVFEYVFAITRGGPGTATETIQYHIWRVGFQFFRLGEGAAMAYTLVFVVVLLLGLLVGALRRERTSHA
jgi:multiple sugar transport system permease protein